VKLNGDFLRFWVGQVISNLGGSFTQFALPLLVFKLTGSPIDLAATTSAGLLPFLFFGLLIGAWMDRLDRRRLMILTDLANAAAIVSIPLLSALGSLSIWWIYIVSFLNSALTLAFQTGQYAAIPHLVDKENLVTANGRLQASFSAASVVGPLLAGLLVSVAPVETVLLVDGFSFAVSATLLALIRRRFDAAEQAPPSLSLRHDIAEGLRYVLRHPILRNIAGMMALLNLVTTTAFAEVVLFAKRRLEASDTRVGMLFAAGSLGVVVLTLLAGPLRKRLSFSRLVLPALVLEGLATIAFSTTRWYWAALPLWALISGIPLLIHVNNMSLRQEIVPNHLLGRVVSVAGMLAWSAAPLGVMAGGWAISATQDVALVYGAIGGVVVLIGIGFSLTALGRAERYLVPEAQTEPAQP
jgi:MFS family permease